MIMIMNAGVFCSNDFPLQCYYKIINDEYIGMLIICLNILIKFTVISKIQLDFIDKSADIN